MSERESKMPRDPILSTGGPHSLTEALRIFKAKAPVCLCGPTPCGIGADMCGPQKKAHRARHELIGMGVWFPAGMATALGHAMMDEGRGEFDELMADAVWSDGTWKNLGGQRGILHPSVKPGRLANLDLRSL